MPAPQASTIVRPRSGTRRSRAATSTAPYRGAIAGARASDWMFALVRTELDRPKHDGISYLLIDMKTPGIEVRPLRQMTGDADFNEVFFDNARAPAENIVGKRGQGWVVSRSTLKHERALIGGSHLTRRTFDGLVMLAQALDR